MDYLLGDDKASKIDFRQLQFDHDRTVAAGSEHIGVLRAVGDAARRLSGLR